MSSNIHGISCTANNYLKEAWSNIKNEHEKNQKYSITLFENTLVCFIQLYNHKLSSLFKTNTYIVKMPVIITTISISTNFLLIKTGHSVYLYQNRHTDIVYPYA